ncbi:MAG: histone deacetylase [Acidobacteriota bacterium]|nr:MAG: histone deacetylase [Acidobacteriota bacterium]
MKPELLIFYDDGMLRHDTGPGHPEKPARLAAVRDALRAANLGSTRWERPKPASRGAIESVHEKGYVERLEALEGRSTLLDPDTPVCSESVSAARLAAGALVDAVSAVSEGESRRALALVRPPGHHAEVAAAMGFCLFNNVAIGAAHSLSLPGCQRVLIVDWDVHHGNGTQHIFESRADVLVFNTHRYPFYPGSGAINEIGSGEGRGYTVNVPLPSGTGDGDYLDVYRRLLTPIARAYEPDLIIVSAGFDAHVRDPLGGMSVTSAGFALMCDSVRVLADELCAGRLVLALEGGYDLTGLASSVVAVAGVLTGSRPDSAVHKPSERGLALIEHLREHQRGFWPVA